MAVGTSINFNMALRNPKQDVATRTSHKTGSQTKQSEPARTAPVASQREPCQCKCTSCGHGKHQLNQQARTRTAYEGNQGRSPASLGSWKQSCGPADVGDYDQGKMSRGYEPTHCLCSRCEPSLHFHPYQECQRYNCDTGPALKRTAGWHPENRGSSCCCKKRAPQGCCKSGSNVDELEEKELLERERRAQEIARAKQAEIRAVEEKVAAQKAAEQQAAEQRRQAEQRAQEMRAAEEAARQRRELADQAARQQREAELRAAEQRAIQEKRLAQKRAAEQRDAALRAQEDEINRKRLAEQREARQREERLKAQERELELQRQAAQRQQQQIQRQLRQAERRLAEQGPRPVGRCCKDSQPKCCTNLPRCCKGYPPTTYACRPNSPAGIHTDDIANYDYKRGHQDRWYNHYKEGQFGCLNEAVGGDYHLVRKQLQLASNTYDFSQYPNSGGCCARQPKCQNLGKSTYCGKTEPATNYECPKTVQNSPRLEQPRTQPANTRPQSTQKPAKKNNVQFAVVNKATPK